MIWGPDTAAGFVLAALLSDDRELAQVAGCVAEQQLPALQARLAQARLGERGMRALLARLRPELDARALALPPRMQGLLARLSPGPLRKQLAHNAPPGRKGFAAEPELLAALARIARSEPPHEVP